MCDLCHRAVCDSRCPNAPEPQKFGECAECGENILDGDEYYLLGGEYYCESCVRDSVRIAEVD